MNDCVIHPEHYDTRQCPWCLIEENRKLKKALEAIKQCESKGQARRIAIQGLGDEKEKENKDITETYS